MSTHLHRHKLWGAFKVTPLGSRILGSSTGTQVSWTSRRLPLSQGVSRESQFECRPAGKFTPRNPTQSSHSRCWVKWRPRKVWNVTASSSPKSPPLAFKGQPTADQSRSAESQGHGWEGQTLSPLQGSGCLARVSLGESLRIVSGVPQTRF